MDDTRSAEAKMRLQLENRLAEYGITHLAIQNVRRRGEYQMIANLNDTRNDQAVQILIDRVTGYFIDVDILPVQTEGCETGPGLN